MKLERTKALIHNGVDLGNPRHGLIHVLEAALELVSLPDNDFSWSSWADASAGERPPAKAGGFEIRLKPVVVGLPADA
jgi:hypothetical protein